MATSQETAAPQAALLDPEKVVPKQRLRRAFADPAILDEFLVNPHEVASRYNVSLTEEEIAAVRNVSYFLASWDFFCGECQWLERPRFNGQITTSSLSIADAAVDRVRARIGEEILRDMPRAIRRVISEIGGDTLVDPQERVDELPEHIQPLARTLRQLVHSMTREMTRELSHTPFYPLHVRPGMAQPAAPGFGAMQPGAALDGIMGLGQALQEVINHAAQEAVEHVRPQIMRQPPWRPSATQPHGAEQVTR